MKANVTADLEMIGVELENYSRLQHIKSANGGHENPELEYQIKLSIAKLSSYGVSVEDLTM